MTIKSIHILGFGKFSDFSLDFKDGANIVYGRNEDGKTTIMAFIKMMFYGTTKKQSESFNNPRKRYKPLNVNTFGGNIVFCHKGTNYRLEREFKGSNSTDKITLYNLDRLEPIGLKSSDVGSEFFSLSADAFEKSVYIGNIGYEDPSSVGGEINSKLANITQTGDEDVSFDLIKKRLNNFKSIYTTPRKVGVLDATEKKLSNLNEELSSAQDEQRKKQEIADTLKSLESQKQLKTKMLDELKNTLEKLEASDKLCQLKQKLDTLNKCNEYKENIAKLENELSINGKMPQRADIALCLSSIAVLDSLSEKITNLKSAAPTSNASIDYEIEQKQNELKEVESKLQNQKKYKASRLNVVLCSVFAALTLGSLLGILMSELFIIPTALFSIIYIVLIVTTIFKKSKLSSAKQVLESQKSDLVRTIQDLRLKKLESDNGSLAVADNLNVQAEEEFKKLTDILSSFTGQDISTIKAATAATMSISKKLDTLADLKTGLETLTALVDISEYNSVKAECEELEKLGLLPASDDDINFAKEQLDKTTNEISNINAQIANYSGILSSSFGGKKTVSQIEMQIQNLKKDAASFEKLIAATDIALNSLNDAYSSLRGSFGGALNKKVAEILSGLTHGKYASVGVSDSLCVNLDCGVLTDARQFSSGTLDQAYFALRLGVAELISDDLGGLPILLDDAFLQYDDERMKNGFKFLSDYKGQSVMFTCRREFADFAATLKNTNVVNL